MRDTYSQPNAPDPVLDAGTVLRLVRRHVPRAREVTSVDESGGEARSYGVDADLVFKTQRPHRLRPRTSIEKEARFLDALAAHGGIAVPRNLGYGREGSIEYIVQSRVPGVALRHHQADARGRARVLEALGHTLRQIHSVDQSFADDPLFPGDRAAADLRERFDTIFQRASAELAGWPRDIDLRALGERVLRATPHDAKPVALHSNPGPEHTFVDPNTGSFTGLIDFGDAYRSHPALDLGQYQGEDADALLRGYAADGALPDTFHTVRRLWQIVRQLNRALRGYTSVDAAATSVRSLMAEVA